VTTNGDNGIDPLTGNSTPWAVDYGRITPLLAKSIQDLNLKLEDLATTTPEAGNDTFTNRFFSSLFTRITAWFANAANGITKFFAGEVHTDKLCVGEAYVTEDEFRSLLTGSAAAGAQQSGAANGAAGGSSASTGREAADTETSSTPTEATSTQSVSAPANDNEPVAEEGPTPTEPEPDPEPELPLANDNFPIEQLPATGTE
jgi:hypothetical protein